MVILCLQHNICICELSIILLTLAYAQVSSLFVRFRLHRCVCSAFFCLIVAETCSHSFCIVDTSVLHVKCCSGFRSFACQSCSVRVSCVSNVLTSASDLFVFRFDWSVSQRHAACLQVHSLAARFQGAVACSHGSLSLWLGFDGLRRQPHCLPYRSQMHCPSLPLQLLWQVRLESHGLLHVARRSWFVRLIHFNCKFWMPLHCSNAFHGSACDDNCSAHFGLSGEEDGNMG
jgi:hypothetical protein